MANKVEMWQAKDGTFHATEALANKHDNPGEFKCPKCDGRGWHDGKPIMGLVYDEEATAWGGQFASPVYKDSVTGYEKETCRVCDGMGWTATEKKPVTETRTVDWQ